MGDLLRSGLSWLEEQRTKHLSRTIKYRRASDELEIQASIGRTVFEQENGSGVIERIETRDYLVLADALAFGGTITLPRTGDQIGEVNDSEVFVYEVMAPGREPAWRYSDPYRKTLRIHTKFMGTESGP